jgi:hypothetical protein
VLLRRVALVWALGAFALLVGLAVVTGIPAQGEQGYWEELAQLVLLGIYAAGVVVSLRFAIAGAVVMAVAAAGVGMLAALEYRPLTAVLPTLVLAVPAVLLWVVWQRRHGPRPVVALALVMVLLLGSAGVGATRVWNHFYGPQHPTSPDVALPVDAVTWVWSGGVEPSGAQVRARLARAGTARLHVADATGQDQWVESLPPPAGADPAVVSFDVTGLVPATAYRYAVEVNGHLDTSRGIGSFATTADGPQSFTVAVASCARLGSSGTVYDTIRLHDPDLFMVTGDWFYEDIATNDLGAFRTAYDTTLTRASQAELYREVPVAYVWDDHDYGPNDADRTSASRPAAEATYRASVPHYDLASPPDGPIAQAFTIGRVRFVLTDGRSARDPTSTADGPGKSMLGAQQRDWLERELRTAAGRYPMVVLVTNVPWIAPASPGADHWGGYAYERRWLADLIDELGLDQRLLMVAGDAHMVAIDDGTNTGYATAGGPAFPLMHAGALDRPGSFKGGPYSEGAHPGAGQFGLIEVVDDGTTIDVQLSGRAWTDEVMVSYAYTLPG